MTMYVPTKTLQEEGKIRVNMKCNPHGCSDDGRRVTFGYWEQSKAYLLGKDEAANQLDEARAFDLKHEQGPFKPT